jgi:hypothetical protein
MILAFAGRRVDAEGSEARFPLANVARVRHEIERVLAALKPTTVVGSAACGADLLVLEVAGALGMRRRIILPFDRATFRSSSVTDRPGEWGASFDAIVDQVSAQGDLVELALDPNDGATYERANDEIISAAETLATADGDRCRAMVIWNGATRGRGDVTEAFLKEAVRRGWSPEVIDTLK